MLEKPVPGTVCPPWGPTCSTRLPPAPPAGAELPPEAITTLFEALTYTALLEDAEVATLLARALLALSARYDLALGEGGARSACARAPSTLTQGLVCPPELPMLRRRETLKFAFLACLPG